MSIAARHCMNRWCDGPEWFSYLGDEQEKHIACPSCGYPSRMETRSEPSAEEIMSALFAEAKK
jgi:hypothetical protein